MMTVHNKYTVLTVLMLCSTLAYGDEKPVAQATKKSVPAVVSNDVIDKTLGTLPALNVSTFDAMVDMSQSTQGKEEQKIMETRSAELSAPLETKRKNLDDKLKEFNAKKDTLSSEARSKQEQELIAANTELQNDVRKAQELIRAEMTKATEKLAKLTDEAAIEVAKAENVDVLLEKNTGRVVYTKNGSDLTNKIQVKMDEKTKLAKAPAKPAASKTA